MLPEQIVEAVKVIKSAILKSQTSAARDVNRAQLTLYYGIGKYVSGNSRKGTWGTGAIDAISEQLQKELPGLRGFSGRNLRNMRKFYEFLSPFLFWQTPSAKLAGDNLFPLEPVWQMSSARLDAEQFFSVGFSHHLAILEQTTEFDEYLYYLKAASQGLWSVIDLRNHLKADDYHHAGTMPSNFPSTIPDEKQALASVRMFKDEYLLDFINVEDLGASSIEDVDERVVEQKIVANIKQFIMTFGRDFAFVGNQFRVEVAGRAQFIDLLFFNRELNALVAVELKTGEFKTSYLGQLHLYLQVLEDQYRKPHENAPIGIILCRSADKAFVEYAVRDYNKPMGVAVYRTADEMPERLRKALPPVEEMRKKLTEC